MKTKVTIELSTSLHQRIADYAKSREISVSAIVRLALLDYAERNNIPAAKPTPNIVSQTTERPRKLSPAEQAALDAEVDREARESWLRDKNQTTERPRELSPIKPSIKVDMQKAAEDWGD
jgi:post-segregation antitoxin (ccd killing protein)